MRCPADRGVVQRIWMALRRSRKLREAASAWALLSSWTLPPMERSVLLGSGFSWLGGLLVGAVALLWRFPQGLGSADGLTVLAGSRATGKGAAGVGLIGEAWVVEA